MRGFNFFLMAVIAFVSGCGWTSEVASNPVDLWNSYDPNRGEFNEEIVAESTTNGIYAKDAYISTYILGEEVRVFCKYQVKSGVTNAPGLLNIHGWMATANIDKDYVADGWAQMSFDYCGKKDDRPHFTKYPPALDHGRMEGKVVRATLPDGSDISDPKQTSHYLWFAIQRRVLSYLIAQKEVDRSRIGAKGYSYGGTLIWNLGMDPRVKAIVAYFGIGWITYHRDKAVWMYNVPASEPPMSAGEKLYLATVESQAHAPYISAATQWLTGSNDHHSGHERGETTFRLFKADVPWSFAVQARGHHNTDKLGSNCKLWLARHVLGEPIAWPARPAVQLALGADGIPALHVSPADIEAITDVQIYQALKTPNNTARSWRDIPVTRSGDTWSGKLPVININDYVFSYANIRYANGIVVSSDFSAAIPAQLGNAIATETVTNVIAQGAGNWSDVAPVEGVGGVSGFRPLDRNKGTGNDQFGDLRWQAPPKSHLSFKFYCTEPQHLVLSADGRFQMAVEITASDAWQSMTVPAAALRYEKLDQQLSDWSKVNKVEIKPRDKEADITKVIFAEFKWLPPQP